jgi:tRNA threonylcarbamoyladenosine biosynthesis protein TsaE
MTALPAPHAIKGERIGAVWITASPEETHSLGERIGRACEGGEVIGLIGPLGTGKTCLVRGVAVALGVRPESVASPTFVLIHEYTGRVPVCHVDLYRLDEREAVTGLGLEEYVESAAVTLIEWAERASAVLPRDHLRITLEHLGGDRRRVMLDPQGVRYEALLARVLA